MNKSTTREAMGNDEAAWQSPSYGGLQDYVQTLVRRRWTILAIFLIVLGYKALPVLTAVPIYRATSQIIIDRNTPKILENQMQYGYFGDEFYQTQYKLLEGPAMASKVADKLNLRNHPFFVEIFRSLPPDADFKAKQQAEQSLFGAVRGGLQVSPVPNSALVDLHYVHPDPDFATKLANAYAESFIDYNFDMGYDASNKAANWLKEKLLESRKQLEESEARLNRYKKEQNIITVEDKESITSQKLGSLHGDFLAAQSRRLEAETKVKELKQGTLIPELLKGGLVPSLKANETQVILQISELGKKYGEKHPRMAQLNTELQAIRAQINTEITNVTKNIKNELQVAQSQENALKEALQGVKGETQDLGDRIVQYRMLLRDVETNRTLYDNMLKSLKAVTTIESFPIANIRIVNFATVPPSPLVPSTSRTLMMGGLLGLTLGVGLALGLESLDTTLKTPAEVELRLGLPNLGMIPHMEFPLDKREASPELVIGQSNSHQATEAYRVLRTSILFSSPGHAPRTILVTSSLPLEGKSLTARNLAAIMTQTESKVLLVDADMRRPTLHQLLQVPKEPGLSNYLVGEVEELPVVPTSLPHLFFLPCGHIPPNPSELLGSERMQEFLNLAKQQFDLVILDSPPLISVTDGVVMGSRTDGVIMVIKAESIPRKDAEEARNRLLEVKAHILGTVLNNVPIKRHGYYYNYYLRYASYYSSDAKTPRRSGKFTPPYLAVRWVRLKNWLGLKQSRIS